MEEEGEKGHFTFVSCEKYFPVISGSSLLLPYLVLVTGLSIFRQGEIGLS